MKCWCITKKDILVQVSARWLPAHQLQMMLYIAEDILHVWGCEQELGEMGMHGKGVVALLSVTFY